jgi:predicted TIM-barrel fold metal-dependent hydrolase
MISIFDSLTHPTISGKWLNSGEDASFSSLINAMQENNIINACAVGLPHIGRYNHHIFAKRCKMYKHLIPIAGYSLSEYQDISSLAKLKDLGFYGIKLHPRYSNFDLKKDFSTLISIFNACHKLDLVVFLCTYSAAEIEHMYEYDPLYELISLLKNSEKVKIVLIHGGLHRIFEYADLARFNFNILLDISYLLVKYQNSSIDNDITYLLNTFDKKICIGSDHPEFSLKETRKHIEFLSQDIPFKKQENYFFKNLSSFLNVQK